MVRVDLTYTRVDVSIRPGAEKRFSIRISQILSNRPKPSEEMDVNEYNALTWMISP
jgi:hypothetical protein